MASSQRFRFTSSLHVTLALYKLLLLTYLLTYEWGLRHEGAHGLHAPRSGTDQENQMQECQESMDGVDGGING